jgi:hypothetical protein
MTGLTEALSVAFNTHPELSPLLLTSLFRKFSFLPVLSTQFLQIEILIIIATINKKKSTIGR